MPLWRPVSMTDTHVTNSVTKATDFPDCISATNNNQDSSTKPLYEAPFQEDLRQASAAALATDDAMATMNGPQKYSTLLKERYANSLGGESTPEGLYSAEQAKEAESLSPESKAIYMNGDGDDSQLSGSLGEISSEESDPENAFSDPDGSPTTEARDSIGKVSSEPCLQPDDVGGNNFVDSLLAKRARVENIITAMNPGARFLGDQPPNGDRPRPKRKAFVPVQHGETAAAAKPLDDVTPPAEKVRKVDTERDSLKAQLKHMQLQLSHFHQRYATLFEQESAAEQQGEGHLEAAMVRYAERQERQARAFLDNGPPSLFEREGEVKNKIEVIKKAGGAGGPGVLAAAEGVSPLDPSQTRQQQQFQQPFGANGGISVKREETLPINGLQFSPKCGDTPADLELLATTLKKEITDYVGTLVDNTVAKLRRQREEQSKSKVESDPPPAGAKTFKPVKNVEATTVVRPEPSKPKTFPDSADGSLSPPKNAVRSKVTDRLPHPLFEGQRTTAFAEFARAHAHLFPPPPYAFGGLPPPLPFYPPKNEPEQNEPMNLMVGTPKKKRTKVTDTRLSPRAARALLSGDGRVTSPTPFDGDDERPGTAPTLQVSPMARSCLPPPTMPTFPTPMLPTSLPTSVAIPNPSLQHSEIMSAMFGHPAAHPEAAALFGSEMLRPHLQSSPGHAAFDQHLASPTAALGAEPTSAVRPLSFYKMPPAGDDGVFDSGVGNGGSDVAFDGSPMTSTLTPMHLRKAKLMFFYVRYPSSAILKVYFPDVKFNKNNTAQLVKWFSNFREFYYIQMEKYARQAQAEGVKNAEDLSVTKDSELYRVLNLHYNRNNQIEVPEQFQHVVQNTLREFFKSVVTGKDMEQSWKKSIYKVIARMDDVIPEYFKSPNWMEHLNDS